MGIQGQLLEVTVVACHKLKDTEWISKQDPYVCLEYGSTKFSTKTCTDGHTDPVFQEKFSFLLIEGLRELTCEVWNSNTIKRNTFIGSGKALLQSVLSSGYDDSVWPLQDKNGRCVGQVRLILHYENNVPKPATSCFARPSPSSFGPYVTQPLFQYPHWCSSTTAANPYPTPAPAAPCAPPARPYPAPSDPYSLYPPPPPSAVYPPPPIYPQNSAYPPSLYPPPPQSSHSFYPPGPYQGTYPPPPY
ncbi:hypothetical protein I3760_05G009400 [Carya illinoinensis]|nr:hypothetical protein I3760_05G009400 [Carya illinoinensis]